MNEKYGDEEWLTAKVVGIFKFREYQPEPNWWEGGGGDERRKQVKDLKDLLDKVSQYRTYKLLERIKEEVIGEDEKVEDVKLELTETSMSGAIQALQFQERNKIRAEQRNKLQQLQNTK